MWPDLDCYWTKTKAVYQELKYTCAYNFAILSLFPFNYHNSWQPLISAASKDCFPACPPCQTFKWHITIKIMSHLEFPYSLYLKVLCLTLKFIISIHSICLILNIVFDSNSYCVLFWTSLSILTHTILSHFESPYPISSQNHLQKTLHQEASPNKELPVGSWTCTTHNGSTRQFHN